MPGITLREFKCTLCKRPFTLLGGDLVLPSPNLCDACLTELWPLDQSQLAAHVVRCLPDAAGQQRQAVVQLLQWQRQQHPNLQDALAERERDRRGEF